MSLRFLAWYFLNINMQNQGIDGHDSVEDALTALQVRGECTRGVYGLLRYPLCAAFIDFFYILHA